MAKTMKDAATDGAEKRPPKRVYATAVPGVAVAADAAGADKAAAVKPRGRRAVAAVAAPGAAAPVKMNAAELPDAADIDTATLRKSVLTKQGWLSPLVTPALEKQSPAQAKQSPTQEKQSPIQAKQPPWAGGR